jgi:Ni/Fe-hydrogenase subunit HybB-like protein
VAWHVALYLSCQALEFSPSVFEWLGLKAPRQWALNITVGLTIAGGVLSTLHQSALGAMFLLMPGKLHPLWYTSYIPWLFFISSIAAGLCVMIVVGALTKRWCVQQSDAHYRAAVDNIALGCGKGCSMVLFAYFGLKLVALAHGHNWHLLATPWGEWFLVELLGFVLLPCLLFVLAERRHSVGLVCFTALWTILGVVINRLNVSLIAFNWQLPHRELLNWNELMVILGVVTLEVLTYRWIINRMPVLRAGPAHEAAAAPGKGRGLA